MRECWINIYPNDLEHRRLGVPSETRQLAVERCVNRRECVTPDIRPAFRIHVRLKPVGAPKRYCDDVERWYWEHYPNEMRPRRSGRSYA